MTNRDYLNSLLRDKEEMFKNIALLAETGERKIVTQALEQYNILICFCQRIEQYIDLGVLNGDAEKKP